MSLDLNILLEAEAITDDDLATVKELVQLYTTYSAKHEFTCRCAYCVSVKVLPKLVDYIIGARDLHRIMEDEREDLIRRNAGMDELLEQIGGFSVHYVKKDHKDEWAKNLDMIDATLTKNREL